MPDHHIRSSVKQIRRQGEELDHLLANPPADFIEQVERHLSILDDHIFAVRQRLQQRDCQSAEDA